MRRLEACLAAAFVVAAILPLLAEEPAAKKDEQHWGNLQATFIYDGIPPVAIPRPVALGVMIVDRSIEVDLATKGVANVVCWLRREKDAPAMDIHPMYAEQRTKPVTTTFTAGLQFEPRITVLQTRQSLKVENASSSSLDLQVDPFANPPIVDIIAAGNSKSYAFDRSENRPYPMSSLIRSWATCYFLIQDHPYVGVSGSNGKLTIRNLPVGNHTFTFWHERSGYLTKVKRSDEAHAWKLGRLTVDIKPGDNDLGEILIKPERRGK
ncbi:hypothetical protein NA78x_001679 [Anatilimnocola sp. NA78]|uniref:hypothetical protein n=1 Tax=Anatilimnocola sp. NA78 TaxID=3415683 RepID=UPI003CE46FD8